MIKPLLCQFFKAERQYKSNSVEMCVEKDGRIHSETVQNAAELVPDLCKRYAFLQTKSFAIMM